MPRNLVARNYKHFTFDLVLWENWTIELEDRAFKVFTKGPIEHAYKVRIGPLAVNVWVKKTLPRSFRDDKLPDDPLFDEDRVHDEPHEHWSK